MRLSDSLSNLPKGLTRLFAALQQAGAGEKAQVRADLVEAIVSQTGADDAASVRLEVKENRKLSPTEVVELVARYQAGASLRALGKEFGLHEQTVRAHLRRQGVVLRPLRALSDEQETEVVRLYVEEMWSLVELGDKFKVSASAIRSVLVRRGVERRAQARRNGI